MRYPSRISQKNDAQTTAPHRHKALFLDRDGVINVDDHYVHKPEDFRFIDGIFELCRKAAANNYKIIVVTNQSGIERGYFSDEAFLTLTRWMTERFANEHAALTKVYYCPSLTGPNRKPNPGLFLAAQREFRLDMASSVSLGDQERDIEAARRAGVGLNVLFSAKTVATLADKIVHSLREMELLL